MGRNFSIDLLRLAATVAVIGLHANFLCDSSDHGCAAATNGVFRLAVPVFFLISGFYFWETRRANRHWSWVKRLLRLYVVWMLVYAAFWLVRPIQKGAYAEIPAFVVFGYYHLWYVIAAAGAAAVTIFALRWGSRWLLLAAAASYGAGVILQYALNYAYLPAGLAEIGGQGWLHRNFLLFGFPFFSIGYLIAEARLPERISPRTAFGLLALSLSLLAVEVFGNYLQSGVVYAFDMYLSLIVAAPILLIAVLLSPWESGQRSLSRFAEAMFFVHILVLKIISEFMALDTLSLTFVCLVLAAPLAVAVIWLNRRTKGILL